MGVWASGPKENLSSRGLEDGLGDLINMYTHTHIYIYIHMCVYIYIYVFTCRILRFGDFEGFGL